MPDLITIEKLVYGGDGLARIDGRVVLTPFVLPGSKHPSNREDDLHARLLQVEQPSAGRVEPGCPYFGTCGGCHYQHAGYEYQLRAEGLRSCAR